MASDKLALGQRFRGFYPVVIDVETGGLDANVHAVLEIACITLSIDEHGHLVPYNKVSYNVIPQAGCKIDPASLQITKININDPLRFAITEKDALHRMFKIIRTDAKLHGCNRAVLVGHNASFDLNFLNAAVARQRINRSPFHPFSTFDTVTLSALAYGQTVLSKAAQCAGLSFNNNLAHSALYDTEITAEVFCQVVNKWQLAHRFEPMLDTDTNEL